ncbi:hypothetical protein LWI29_012976 [Acer saccharum]|uniref:Uncharacterized protein n=2 Tax=Acer saccharum TaxID=4024 RepID=A0AA39T368_ACESA|nr:hypothetical protein LWI29_012976 [Acer saccharum]
MRGAKTPSSSDIIVQSAVSTTTDAGPLRRPFRLFTRIRCQRRQHPTFLRRHGPCLHHCRRLLREYVYVEDLVTQLEGLQTGPTEREKLEKESSVVEEDVNKFNAMIAGFDERICKMEELVEEKDKEMKEKLGEHKRICHENEELKKKVELQTFNAHDAERMKKEWKAVERDIEDAETARSAWEDKCWDLDATLTRKFKELEALSIKCNQAIRKLKLSNDIRYVLSAKGSTPAEVMGIDYKSTLKPTLESFADEVEAQLNLIRKEMQEHTYRCAAEVKKMMEDVQIEAHNLDMVEREAAEVLKVVKLKLQEAVRQSEEEIQIRACDLIALVDSVSKHKEYMESKISEMKSSLL